MPNPKRRHSHSRRGKRRAHDYLRASLVEDCPKCHEKKLSHHACKKCGYYKGRLVIEIKKAE